MTKIGSTDTARQKRKTTLEAPGEQSAAGVFFYITDTSFSTGMIYHTMHPPARTNRSQTGTPGASRTQAIAGGHRAAAVRAVRRVALVAPVTDSPAVPARVQLSSAKMGVLAAQQMVAYMQAQLAFPQHQHGGGSGSATKDRVVFPVSKFFVVTNNKYQKRKRVRVQDTLSLLYKCMNTST